MTGAKKFIKDMFWMEDKNLERLSLKNLKQQMKENQFDPNFIHELSAAFETRINTQGEAEFKKWLKNLHFKVPEEFEGEKEALQVYEKYQSWIDEEVTKLEDETGLPWERQTEDIQHLNHKARKAQLVIRHRLSEIVLELL